MLTLKTYCNTKYLIALLLTLVLSSSAFTLKMGYVFIECCAMLKLEAFVPTVQVIGGVSEFSLRDIEELR
jgi:hypothetical protein